MTLPVSRLIRAQVNLDPQSAQARSFGTLCIASDSNVINPSQRFQVFSDAASIALLLGADDPAAVAAALFFGQTPQPASCMIARWVRTASSALNEGGILSPSEQALPLWTDIAAGSFTISIDGTPQTLTGLDFTGVTNLNGVATVITAALTGSVCTWDGFSFLITSNSSGAGAKASGTITLNTNPANNDTLTINGTLITLVTGTPSGPQVKIGSTLADTAANLQAFLGASSDSGIDQATYSTTAGVITVTDKVIGTAGNSFTLAKSSSHITLSGANLTGGTVPSSVGFATAAGSGTDISAQLMMTSSTAIQLVPGFDAEQPSDFTALMLNLTSLWYGLMFAASVQPTDDQNLAVAPLIQSAALARVFGVTIVDTNVLSPDVSNDLASLLMAGGYTRSISQYSSTNDYAIASALGREFGVDFSQQNSTITLMYKQEPGVDPEDLDTSEADTLEAKRCNVFAGYDNGTSLIQYGTMAGDAYLDEIHGLDWFQNQIQTDQFNVLFTTPTKVLQTDAGVNQLTNAANGSCDDAVFNGLVAPGQWNGPPVGALQTGQYLKTGYYVFTPSISTQSQADRDARKAPPMQIAAKLGGAIQEVDLLIDVNR